jgi:AcrR family transcriptional regulator
VSDVEGGHGAEGLLGLPGQVEDITAEADVSVRTFGNYFASKYEAIRALGTDRARRIGAEPLARPAGEPLWEALVNAMLAHYDGADQTPDREWLTGLKFVLNSPAIRGEYLKISSEMQQALAAATAARTGTDAEQDMYPQVLAGAVTAAAQVAVRRWGAADCSPPAPRNRGRQSATLKRQVYAYVILDGTLIPIDRVAADPPFYSGKHKKHGMNLRVIASPNGGILWVSGALPGSVHDKKAEWVWSVLDELEKAGLVTLADKEYQGSTWAKVPYKGKNKPEPQKEVNRAHAKLRAPGERANAQLKTGVQTGRRGVAARPSKATPSIRSRCAAEAKFTVVYAIADRMTSSMSTSLRMRPACWARSSSGPPAS